MTWKQLVSEGLHEQAKQGPGNKKQVTIIV